MEIRPVDPVNARGLRQVDEKIPWLARGMHLSVVYPVYRASGAYRLNNAGATLRGRQGWRRNERGGPRFGGPRRATLDARLRFDRS